MKSEFVGLETKVVRLEGSYFEMGFQYGQKCRESIRNGIRTNYLVTKFYSTLSREQCVKNVRAYLPLLEREVPNLYDEMRGMAQGARIGLEDIAVLNFHARDLAGGCTMVHIDGELCEGNRSITGQTIDWTPSLAQYYHLVNRRPKKGMETIQFTMAGILGLVGKNVDGLSVFMNILLTSEKVATGVPAYLLLRAAMEEKNIATALKMLEGKTRASPFNYLISDNSGEAFNVEASHENFLPEKIDRGYYVHTNHCLREPMKSADKYVELSKSEETLQRRSRMTDLLGNLTKAKKVRLQDLYSLLSDHENHPDSICRHPRDNLPEEGKMSTLAAVLSREREKGIWVAFGNPCSTELSFFALNS